MRDTENPSSHRCVIVRGCAAESGSWMAIPNSDLLQTRSMSYPSPTCLHRELVLMSHLLLPLGCPWPNHAGIPPGPRAWAGNVGLRCWGYTVGGYVAWPKSTCKLVSPWVRVMLAHAEAFIVIVIFQSCICPWWGIKHYYLIELRRFWGILCCSSGWFSCFTAAIQVSGRVRWPLLCLHPGLAALSPSAALGSGGKRCNVDWRGQSRVLHSV